MSDNNCYLCQEPKSVVGHNTQYCPNVKCKNCGHKGHIHRTCPNFSSNIDQKAQDVCPKEILSEKSAVLPHALRSTYSRHNDTQILDFVQEIGFSEDSKPKLEVKEETLKTKSSGIDHRPDTVDPVISSNKEIMDFVHDIDFSNDMKLKLEIKEEPLNIRDVGGTVNLVGQDVNRNIKTDASLTFFTSSLPKIRWAMANPAHPVTVVDSIMPNEMVNFVHDIEFSDDIKPKLEIKEDPLEVKNENSEKPKLEIKEEERFEIKNDISKFVCTICDFEAPDQSFLDLHFNHKHGPQGASALDQSDKKLLDFANKHWVNGALAREDKKVRIFCDICRVNIPIKDVEKHLDGSKHLKKKSKLRKAPSFGPLHKF